MEGEFNNLNYNNTNITFSVATNNIATSDETSADPIYVRQLGTNYSRSKKVGKAVVLTGLALTITAVAISGGSLIRNVYVPSPPTVTNPTFSVSDGKLSYSFTIENKLGYVTTYFIDINGTNVVKEDCREAREYVGEYSPIEAGSKCKFYVTFTNSFDYIKTVYSTEFIA